MKQIQPTALKRALGRIQSWHGPFKQNTKAVVSKGDLRAELTALTSVVRYYSQVTPRSGVTIVTLWDGKRARLPLPTIIARVRGHGCSALAPTAPHTKDDSPA